ncbi:type II toxin-antitoxin system prevent-host-death family antitoxin [Endozoicomonas sp.]|uniref:type II toxin-antitoxin system prevent-host-death family antitoxin n=1 Tax=Endozoicomonas sp. TaxID=1892382 RepID=UPI0028883DCE|nr:type II toxin-antitoxin system Phd/YefM family antitoxin [Endozoicomonas sp.]
MPALLETADQALPVTRLARQFKLYLDRICNREQDKYVVMRNNEPVAVLLSVEQFEAMVNELEDLRIEAVARERLANFDGKTTISHEEMIKEFKD